MDPRRRPLIDLYQLAIETTNDVKSIHGKESLVPQRSQKRYRKIRHLGTGGTKRVYEVHDQLLKRKVALAVPQRGQDTVHSLIREARLNAQLDHPNIIKVFDLGKTSKGLPFYTMEIKPGEDLKSWLQQNEHQHVETEQKLQIALQLLNAMEYAHQRGIIHLDIKPSNVQIGHHGEVLLCDWGLSQSTEDSPVHMEAEQLDVVDHNMFNDITRIGRAKGTVGYMAPECLSLMTQLNSRCDLYSYGILFLDLLVGLGDQGTNAAERLSQSSLHPSLRAIIQRCIEDDPGERYASAAEIRADLLLFINGCTPSVEKTHVFQDAWRWVKRHQALVYKSIGGLVALFALTWNVFYFYSQVSLERDRVKKENLELEKHSDELKRYVPAEKHENYVLRKIISFGPMSDDINQILLGHKVSARGNAIKSVGRCALIHFLRQEFDLSLGYAKRLADDEMITFSKVENVELEALISTLELVLSEASTSDHDQIRAFVIHHLIDVDHHHLARLWVCADWWMHQDRQFYEKNSELMGRLCAKGFGWVGYHAQKDVLTLFYGLETIRLKSPPFPLMLPMKRVHIHSLADMNSSQFNRYTVSHLHFSGAKLHGQDKFRPITEIEVNAP